MIELKQTEVFRSWWIRLKDEHVRGVIAARLDRLGYGLPGDVKPLGEGISELRIHVGPGYRIYFKKQGCTIIILLCGGDKGTQARDLIVAKRLARDWDERP